MKRESSSPAQHRNSPSKFEGRRWAVTAVVLVAMVTYYIYTPVPAGVTEPWKARHVMALLRTIGHISYFSEKVGLASRFNATRFLVDNLSKIPPKNYAGLKVHDTYFRGVKVRVYLPDKRRVPGPAVIFYHGGGWIMGGVESHDHMTTALAQRLQVVLVSVEYRLCPEHPYPLPLEDCLNATLHLYDNAAKYGVDTARIALVGDSAGGNLVAAAALRLRSILSHPPPLLQVLIYPLLQAVDLSLPSYIQNDGAVLGTRQEIANVILLYMGKDPKHTGDLVLGKHVSPGLRYKYTSLFNTSVLKSDRAEVGRTSPGLAREFEKTVSDPYFMPLMAEDLRGLPQTLVVTCEHDVLRDDGAIYSQRLKGAGVKVTYRNYKHSYHGMLAFFDHPIKTEEGSHMMEDTARYIRDNL